MQLSLFSLWRAGYPQKWWTSGGRRHLLLAVVTSVAMALNLMSFVEAENWLLLGISAALIVLEIWIVLEGIAVFRREKSESPVS